MLFDCAFRCIRNGAVLRAATFIFIHIISIMAYQRISMFAIYSAFVILLSANDGCMSDGQLAKFCDNSGNAAPVVIRC
jgi:hypothetical protein